MIPLLWAALSASAISVAHSMTSSSGSGTPRNVMFQRRAFHELHGNKRLAVLRVDLVDGADVGMIQRGRRTRLSAKTFQSLRILGQVIGKKFKRDKPTKGCVFGLVDDAHTAATQHLNDSVMGDGLTNHWVDNRRLARCELVWLQAATVVIQEIADIGEWSVQRTSVSLLRVQKLEEVGL